MRNTWGIINSKVADNSTYEYFQEKFIASISLFTAVASVVAIVFNSFLGFTPALNIITFLSALIYLVIYYLVRFKRKRKTARAILTVYSLIFFNILWFVNYGSNGPVPYFILVYIPVIIFLWGKKYLSFIGTAVFFNILLLFGTELLFQDYFDFTYPSDNSRIIDSYISLIMYAGIIYILIINAKTNLETLVKKAQQADKLKTSFLSNVSHEIRTPLNALLGLSDLVTRKEGDPEKRELYTRLIKSNGESLLRLIDDIIDISKIESNHTVIIQEECSVNNLLGKIYDSFLPVLKSYQKEHLVFNYIKPSPAFIITTDCVRLEQILSNLISNAIKFTSKGSVFFGCEVKDEMILFFVKDTGQGIPEGYTEEIFERFTKLDVEFNRYEQGGLGIGLFLSRHLITLMGGEIWVESTPGKGSEFYFTVPKNDFRENVSPTKERSLTHFTDLSGKKILVAEDNDSNFELISEILKESNANVFRAKDGREALEMVMKDSKMYDLILMDISMPVMDGYEATRKIRVFNDKVPVIALTAYAMSGDRQKSIQAGCDEYIAKPVNREKLFSVIHKQISKKMT